MSHEEARCALMEEFIGNEKATLDDAFDGPLFDALRDLGRTLADEYRPQILIQEAIDAFQKAVNAAANKYADAHVAERAADIAEDRETFDAY